MADVFEEEAEPTVSIHKYLKGVEEQELCLKNDAWRLEFECWSGGLLSSSFEAERMSFRNSEHTWRLGRKEKR